MLYTYTTSATHRHTPLSCPSAGLLLTMVRWYFPAWRSLRTRSSSSTRAVNLQEENMYRQYGQKSIIWAKYATGRVKTWGVSTSKVFISQRSSADEDLWGRKVPGFYSSCCVFCSYNWVPFICWRNNEPLQHHTIWSHMMKYNGVCYLGWWVSGHWAKSCYINEIHICNRVVLLIAMMADYTHLHNSFNSLHAFHVHIYPSKHIEHLATYVISEVLKKHTWSNDTTVNDAGGAPRRCKVSIASASYTSQLYQSTNWSFSCIHIWVIANTSYKQHTQCSHLDILWFHFYAIDLNSAAVTTIKQHKRMWLTKASFTAQQGGQPKSCIKRLYSCIHCC